MGLDGILTRMGAAYGVMRGTFGLRVRPLIAGGLFGCIRAGVAAGMALDPWLFPRLRQTVVRRPIVLVGNPRTGTTFLQRFLCDQGYGSGLAIWQMLYPSLTLQAALRPFLPVLEIVSPAKYHSTPAHQTSLTSVETDDVGVLFRHFDGFFLYGFFLAFAEEEMLDQFDPSVRDTTARDFDWLDALWTRSIVANGSDTVIAKLFSLGPRMPQFLERFPDARILYMVRDPVDIIPSGMSLVTGVLDNAFGFWSLPEEARVRWCTRLYAAFIELLRRFHDDWQAGLIPHDRVFLVRYDRMMADFEGLMDEMHGFLDVQPTAAQTEAIRAQGERQRAYTSEHRYDLARFGLDADRIREDCAFFYDAFLPADGRNAAGRRSDEGADPAVV